MKLFLFQEFLGAVCCRQLIEILPTRMIPELSLNYPLQMKKGNSLYFTVECLKKLLKVSDSARKEAYEHLVPLIKLIHHSLTMLHRKVMKINLHISCDLTQKKVKVINST